MIEARIESPNAWQIDPARAKCVAVLCGPALCILDHSRAEATACDVHNIAGTTLDQLIEGCVQAQCGALWLLPVAGSEPRSSYDAPWLVSWEAAARSTLTLPQVMPDYPLRFHELSQKNRIAGLVAQRKRGGMPLCIYAAWYDMWNVAGVLDELPAEPMQRARAFAQGVRLAAFALDAQLRFSPSYTGLQVLRQTLASKPYEISPLSGWARELVMEHRPTYVQWCRAISEREAFTWQHELPHAGLLIHKYDRNSSFVASAGEVPVGDPKHTTEFMPGCPGLYRIAAWPGSLAQKLPGLFHVGAGAGEYPFDGGEDLWAWEPQMRLAARMGWQVKIYQGYYWPKGKGGQVHDLFRTWRERIWLARTQAEVVEGPVGRIARAIIKRVGVSSVGRLMQQHGRAVVRSEEAQARELTVLSHEVDDWGELTGTVEVEAPMGKVDLAQPHWWSTIIANANERLMAALYAHVTSVPVAAYVDAVYSLGPWPPADIEPQRLGKWKLERQTLLGSDQVEQLNAHASDPERDGAYSWVAQLARYAGVPDGD